MRVQLRVLRGMPRRDQGYAIGLLVMLVPLIIGVVFIIVSFAIRPQAALSSFVQSHGVRRAAVILNVDNIAHTTMTMTSPGGNQPAVASTQTTYTADVLVSLADPVDGQARTTVHVPGYDKDGPGDTLTVLVDPDNPGYAELPGSPSTAAFEPTLFLILGIFFTVGAIVGTWLLVHFWRRSRRRALA
jgi:hypothetical protein